VYLHKHKTQVKKKKHFMRQNVIMHKSALSQLWATMNSFQLIFQQYLFVFQQINIVGGKTKNIIIFGKKKYIAVLFG